MGESGHDKGKDEKCARKRNGKTRRPASDEEKRYAVKERAAASTQLGQRHCRPVVGRGEGACARRTPPITCLRRTQRKEAAWARQRQQKEPPGASNSSHGMHTVFFGQMRRRGEGKEEGRSEKGDKVKERTASPCCSFSSGFFSGRRAMAAVCRLAVRDKSRADSAARPRVSMLAENRGERRGGGRRAEGNCRSLILIRTGAK